MIKLMISLGQLPRRILLAGTLIGALIACSNATPNFSLRSVKTISIEQGKTGKPGIFVSKEGSFSDEVFFAFSAAGQLPAGLTLSFQPASSKVYTELSISASETTPPGEYPLTIRGVSGNLDHSIEMILKILDKPFTITLGDTARVERGSTIDVPLTITRRAGYTAKLGFIIDTANDAALPEALKTAQFVPSDTDPDKGNLRFTVPLDVKAGDYSILVKARGTSAGQGYEVSRTLSLSVVNPPNPDYTVTSSVTAFSFTNIGEQTATVTVGRLRGYSEAVKLDLIARDNAGGLIPLPAGIEGNFTPLDATTNTSTFTLKALPGILNATSKLLIRGVSGSITHEQEITVTVNIQPNFLVQIESNFLTIRQGESFATNVTVSPYAGYTGSVSLKLTNQDGTDPQAGITATFTPTPITVNGVATSSIKVLVGQNVPISDSTAGNYYNLRVEARPSDKPNDPPRVVNFKLNVLPDIIPGMNIVLPEQVFEILGNEFAIPISIVRIGNFTADATLEMPAPPTTFTNIRFNPKILTASLSTSQVTFTPDFTTKAGTYTVTIKASAGDVSAQGDVKVNVADFKMGVTDAIQKNVTAGGSVTYEVGRPAGYGYVVRLRLLQKDATTGQYVEVPAGGNAEIASYNFGLLPFLPGTDQVGLFTTLTINTKAGIAPKRLDLRVAGESSTDMNTINPPLKPIQRRYVDPILNIQ